MRDTGTGRGERPNRGRHYGTRARLLAAALALGFALVPGVAPAAAQAEDDDVRDAFIVSRQKQASPRRARAKPSGRAAARLGLAYSVYRRDEKGDWIRVDPGSDFKAGDAVRLVVESNSNGYLYVFNQTNDGEPRMIFPDGRYNGGDNAVRAHVLYDVPPSRDERARTWWFRFGGQSGTERLFVLLSRRPLAQVPIRRKLEEYCEGRPGGCAWSPTAAVWREVAVAATSGYLAVSRTSEFGQRQSANESLALKRELEATSDVPEPSVVVMTGSAAQSTIVAEIALKHE